MKVYFTNEAFNASWQMAELGIPIQETKSYFLPGITSPGIFSNGQIAARRPDAAL